MPSGKVHDRITVVAAAVSAPAWATAAWASPGISPAAKDWTVGAALVVSLLFSGLLLSPDLDLDSSIYKRWGPFRFIWWPYQKLMPHPVFLVALYRAGGRSALGVFFARYMGAVPYRDLRADVRGSP